MKILMHMLNLQFILISFGLQAQMPENIKKFLYWEYYSNSANNPFFRGPQNFQCEHFEIPQSLMTDSLFLVPDHQVKKSLIVKKINPATGLEEDHVRWIINPDDSIFHKKLEEYLISNNIDTTKFKTFDCYKTASRSLLVHDLSNNNIFSVKVSTNNTGGLWVDKKLDRHQVLDGFLATKYAQLANTQFEFDHLVLAPEPIGFSIVNDKFKLDQGMLIRTYDELYDPNTYYLPGFAALHQKTGDLIAHSLGSEDPSEFWQQHYIKPLAEAGAELAAHFGLVLSSAHSQQYLIELKRKDDSSLHPTGRIVIRDFSDSHLFTPLFNISHAVENDLLKNFQQDPDEECLVNELTIYFGALHGMHPPTWIDLATYNGKFQQEFFNSFEKMFHLITGVDIKKMKEAGKVGNSSEFSYWHKTYNHLNDKSWADYLALRDCFKGHATTSEGIDCRQALKKFLVTWKNLETINNNHKKRKRDEIEEKDPTDDSHKKTKLDD